MSDEPLSLREETLLALEQLQAFDCKTLARKDELGSFAFDDAIAPAQQLINLYGQLPLETIDVLPDGILSKIKVQAAATQALFELVRTFSLDEGSVTGRHDQLVQKIIADYSTSFTVLHPWISYSIGRATNLDELAEEARAKVEEINNSAARTTKEIEEVKTQVTSVLEDVRRVAEEQGVSQEAHHFTRAAENHDEKADEWFGHTKTLAWILAVYAVLTLFVHKIPWFAPESTYDTVQLGISKFLIFGVISYMLVLAARNYMAQKHNAILNKHRADALLTYRSLVEAGEEKSNRDIVLSHAAGCIYEAKPTGYAKYESSDDSAMKAAMSLIGTATRS